MAISRGFLLAILALCATTLTGCPGNGSHPAANRPHASSVAPPDTARDLVGKRGHPATKSAPREPYLSSYRNPEEGISFRYPRYYALEEGELEEHSFFLQRQDELDVEQPGARLVATLLIPEDGYPNTTFEHGSLQLVVNDAVSSQGCQEFAKSADLAGTALKSLTLEGFPFRGTEWQYETAGTHVVVHRYAAYAYGQCHEFTLVVAAEIATDPDGITKPADEARIMRQLEKILGSVQFQEPRVPPAQELGAEDASRS